MVLIYWAQTYEKSARALIITVEDDHLEINAERTTRGAVSVFWQQTVGQNYSVKITSQWFESVTEARQLKKTLANQNCMQEKSKSRLNWGNMCYHFAQNVLSLHSLPFCSECSVAPSATILLRMFCRPIRYHFAQNVLSLHLLPFCSECSVAPSATSNIKQWGVLCVVLYGSGTWSLTLSQVPGRECTGIGFWENIWT
jgi:hypothetical protein